MSEIRKPKILTDKDLEQRSEKYSSSLAPNPGFWGIFPILFKLMLKNIKTLGSPDAIRSFNPQAKIMDEQVRKIEEPPSAMDDKNK